MRTILEVRPRPPRHIRYRVEELHGTLRGVEYWRFVSEHKYLWSATLSARTRASDTGKPTRILDCWKD